MSNEGVDIVLLGPTCAWKSEAAIAAAQALDCEIVSCDSMQVYRGLEIGTAQPSPAERGAVPHHLIGVLDMDAPYDVNRFLIAAKRVLSDIHSRNKRALIVGGTGMYARALVYGLSLLPADPDVFKALQAELDPPGGHQRLAARLEAAVGSDNCIPRDVLLNPRRLLRACEVTAITGRPPWALNPGNTTPNPAFRQYIVLPDFAMLKERIRLRTAAMLARGWIDEARRALEAGLMRSPTARQALGYRDIAAFLDGRGAANADELESVLANRTIQYARRQLTWFKHQHPGAAFIAIEQPDGAAARIVSAILGET